MDVENLIPGRHWQDEAEEVIRTCRAAAVFVGQSGIGPPPLHNLPYPPLGDLLKGRDEELRKLSESLEADGRTAIVQHKALYGLGGIGKTRLAVEHAWASGYQAAFFVRADTPAGLRTGLATLARVDLLNLEERRSEEETVHAVLGWLKANPSWLLILDNVDTSEAESEVLALLPGLTGGRVLITSRLRSWPRTSGRITRSRGSPKEIWPRSWPRSPARMPLLPQPPEGVTACSPRREPRGGRGEVPPSGPSGTCSSFFRSSPLGTSGSRLSTSGFRFYSSGPRFSTSGSCF